MRETAIAYALAGQYLDECCDAAGMGISTWLKYQALAIVEIDKAKEKAKAKGHDNYHRFIATRDREYVVFVEAMWRARSQAKTIAATEFRKKDPGEYLARIDHERWGRKDHHTFAGDPDHPLTNYVHIYLPDNGRGPVKPAPEKPPLENKSNEKK